MFKFFAFLVMLTASVMCLGQETTGSIAGTVKDATGAVIPGAKVTVTTPTLVGEKSLTTDGKGYYHFSNLPPGPYVIVVEAKGFAVRKQTGLVLEVGHEPTIDLTLAAGSDAIVVDVSSQSPPIDVTSVTTQDNISQDVVNFVPRGTSFQSVIQFAPAASNEPLMGSNTMSNGTGSVSPGNGSNGNPYGFSVAGGADSENSYLVEGQETANLIGGYSHTSVPFDFIDQVNVETSGITSEYGGALGGVINVIMKKGSSSYHGSLFASFQDSAMNSGPNAYLHYDAGPNATFSPYTDATVQEFQPKKPNTSDFFPGFTFGGRLLPFSSSLKDKLFFFVGFNPELQRYEETLNYGPASAHNASTGAVPYSQNTDTYYTTARIDAQVTKKIRVFGSWLYQLQHQNGEHLPATDSVQGYNFTTGAGQYNPSVSSPVTSFAHTLGYSAPNVTLNTGADITITPSIVSTTRFGYYFENYHDFGYPTGGDVYVFETSGTAVGASALGGGPLPAAYQEGIGYQSGPLVQLTAYNANKAIQLNEAVSWYKSTAFGTHNFKFGYDLSRDSNLISQSNNEPEIEVFTGATKASGYAPQTTTGVNNCAPFVTANGPTLGCQGTYGYVTYFDSGTGGSAISYNHSIFGQDSWNIGRGVTIDAGVRVEHEFLPGEIEGYSASVVPPDPINFGWKQKIQPRIGASWDVFRNGKMKVYGSYGVFDDQMKLNLAISSFGGQYWQNCSYANSNANLSAIAPSYTANRHYCTGTNPGVNASAPTPPNTTFLEDINFRAAAPTCSTCNPYEEAVAPNLKPYQQHESNFGVDYQLSKTLTFASRWDRRRLDHVIEDSSIFNASLGGETFVIVNPGQGVNSTYLGFCDFLYSTDPSGCASTSGQYPPPNEIPAARSYDGLEFRLTKAMSNHWYGMVSYTYSHFRGNYTGLTSSDLSDGGAGGRNSPNNSRAFDEPYFQFNANGQSSSGLLPTDRPNKIKGYGYYRLSYLHKFTTDFGIFQYFYQGSPETSYADVGASFNEFPVKVFNWGKWADITQNPNTGLVTVGTPHTYRTPWYNQTDFNITQSYKITEAKSLDFQITATNLLNDHSVTAYSSQIDSLYTGNDYITPGGNNIGYFGGGGTAFYASAESPYNVQASLNGVPIGGAPSNGNNTTASTQIPEVISGEYGKPIYWQLPRVLRVAVHFTF